jgi:hypothetical protein
MAIVAEENKTGASAGWYEDADGARTYWDGAQWLRPASDPPAASELPREPTFEPAPRRTRKKLWIIAGIPLVIVAAGGITAAALGVNAGASERDAEASCRTEIVSILKSPTTATLSDVRIVDRVDHVNDLMLSMYDMLGQDSTTEEATTSLAELRDKTQGVVDDEAAKDQVTWFVVGTVDSENGFGAMVRNTWTCETLFENGAVKSGPDATFDGED